MSSLFKGHIIGMKSCPLCSGAYPKECWCGGMIHVHAIVDVKMRNFMERDYLFHCDSCGMDAPNNGGRVPEGDS